MSELLQDGNLVPTGLAPAASNDPVDLRDHPWRHPWIAVVVLVVLAAVLRLAALDRVPPAISQDEAMNAYDAYCLRVAGKDHREQSWPIFFRAFGDFHPSPPVYLQIPFQWLLGMNEWSARLPDVLFGVAHVLFVYLLVSRFYQPRAGLWAAGLLAVSPWHIHLSRLAFGIATSVSLVTLAILALSCAMKDGGGKKRRLGRIGWIVGLIAAGCGLGVAFWTYHAMRVVVPLLIVGGAFFGFPAWRSSFRTPILRNRLIAIAAGLAIGIAPFVWAWIKTPNEAWARATEVFLLNNSSSYADTAKTMLRNYAAHFSPAFFFKEGDLSLIRSVPGYGQLHLVYAILLPLGLYRALRLWRTERFGLFVLWWILIAPIPASLTMLEYGSGHCLRSAGVLPAYEILAALGLDFAVSAAQRRSPKVARGIQIAAFAAVGFGTAYFGYIFFVRYPVAASRDYLVEWKPVIQDIQKRQEKYDAVMITNIASGHIGILYLFYSETDPRAYFGKPRAIWHHSGTDFLARWGKFYFASVELLPKVLELLPPKARLLVAERPNIRVPGRVLKRFNDLTGRCRIILYEVTAERRQSEPPTSQQG